MKGLIYIWPLGVTVGGCVNGKEGEGKLKAISEDLGGVVRSFFFFPRAQSRHIIAVLPFCIQSGDMERK